MPSGQGEKAGGTDKPQEDRNETGGESEAAEPGRGREGEQKPVETAETESSLERKPSYWGFANLAEEFDARRASRETSQENDASNEQPSETTKPDPVAAKLDDDPIKEQVDPFAPNPSKTEGYKETFERTVRDSDAEWTEGVDRVEDLPTGEDLTEPNESAPKSDRFRRAAAENYASADAQAKKVTKSVFEALEPRPTGQHVGVRHDGPVMEEPAHSGIDAGSMASAALATGIVLAEIGRWCKRKVSRRGTA